MDKKKKLIYGFLMLALRVLFIALALLLLFGKVFLLYRVHGMDMYPAVKDGDLLLAYRMEKNYERGDVVVYFAGSLTRVGRLVAMSGDRLEFGDTGTLFVNGVPQREDTLFPTLPGEDGTEKLDIPQDSVYILGDYRTNSVDSRAFGPVSTAQLEGKLIWLFRIRGF